MGKCSPNVGGAVIDWITARLAYADPSVEQPAGICGRVAHYAESGELRFERCEWRALEGSYAARINLRTDSTGLWISGNPAKFLTGQNVDGPDDIPRLLDGTLDRISSAIPFMPALDVHSARLTRIDITRSIDLGRVERVREVLRVAGVAASARHRGRASTSHETVYFGRHSRRSSLKLYSKGDELVAHPPVGLPIKVYEAAVAAAGGLLRIELTLRSMQLKDDDAHSPLSWDRQRMDAAWLRHWSGVTISCGVILTDEQLLDLSPALRRTFSLWLYGENVFEKMSNGTKYRHRKAILEATAGQCDIFILQPPQAIREPLTIHDIGAWLREAPIWHATGELAEWIERTA